MPFYSNNPQTAFEALRTYWASRLGEIVVDTSVTLTANTTIAGSIRFSGGGYLTVDTLHTVTFSNAVAAEPKHFIFRGAGDYDFNSKSVALLYPYWFGALGNNSADDYQEIQKTVDAAIQNTSNSGHWWKDVTIKFANASQAIEQRSSQLTWSGGSVDTSTASPTALFVRGDAHWRTELTGVDLSGLGSGKSLVTVTGDQQRWVTVRNCKLGSSVALTTGTWGGHHSGAIQLVNSDSGDTNYRYQRSCYQGDIYSESTVVRSGGATDGTTPISRKMVSSANAKYYAPLESQEFVFWNDTTGSVTVTFQTVTDNVTLTDAEAWVEVDYLGNGSFPISSRATDRSTDILASAANQTTSTETWTTTGLTTPVPQKLAVTFTTAEKGLISARVMLAKASTTVYVCPEILTTAGRSYMLPSGNYINEPSTSGGSSSYSRARVVNQ
jgi:hypothetical protein